MRCWIMRRQWLSGIAIRLSGRCPRACATIRYSWISCELLRVGGIMAGTTVSAGKQHGAAAAGTQGAYSAACRLVEWLERNGYEGYDTFDGLNSRLLRPLTFNSPLLRTVLQQGIRRFPINLRPLVGIAKSPSSKAMGFIARGFLRL